MSLKCIFCGGNPVTSVMSCKGKKNKQEEFHLAFICRQIRRAFCLKCSDITTQMPIEGGFSQPPWPLPSLMPSARIHSTHLGSPCFQFCPVLDFPFPPSWISSSPIKGKATFAQGFILQQGQAAQAANQPHWAAGRGGSPQTGGNMKPSRSDSPLAVESCPGSGTCRTTPWSHPCPHSTQCAFPMQDTHKKVML